MIDLAALFDAGKIAKPAIILPRPKEIIRPGDPRFVVPALGGFALTALSGFGSGGETPSTPVVSTYVTVNGAGLAAGSKTWSGISIGSASADRYVVMASGVRHSATCATTGVTLDGNAMTQVGSGIQSGAGAVRTHSSLWILAWATGTTADIVATFAATGSGCGIAIWTLTGGLLSPTPTSVQTSTAEPGSVSIDCSAGGSIIAYYTNWFSGAAGTSGHHTWTNGTERFDRTMNSGGEHETGANDDYATAQTALALSCSRTDGAAESAAFIAAAFR